MPGLSSFLGGGGFSGSSSASSDATTGGVGFGGFNFQPKGGNLPPSAWIALAVAAVMIAALAMRKGR